MRIESGDGFILSNGRRVRVSCIYDVYDAYDPELHVGHDPETHVRYSHWWHSDRLIASREKPLQEFLDDVEEQIPSDELPESQKPGPKK